MACTTASCRAPEAGPGNLLMIVIDTCRQDHLSLYGYGQATTPRIERWAAGGVVFDQAVSHVPQTLPSVATLLTSTPPHEHGVRVNGLFRLGESSLTLAEVLAQSGRRTGAVVSAFPLDARFGIAQGFDFYDADFRDSILTRSRLQGFAFQGERYLDFEQRADEATDKALAWLRAQVETGLEQPFFLLVHYFDPHHPYAAPEAYAQGRHPYDGELAFVDAEIGRLFDGLRGLGLKQSTLVVLTGDHGELLGPPPPRSRHAGQLEDAVLRVPLVLKWPGVLPAGRRVGTQVGLVDVAPTVLEALGVAVPAGFRGRSLLPLARGEREPPRPPLRFETLYWRLEKNGGPARYGARTERLKYVRNLDGEEGPAFPPEELYHLRRDPAERVNLLARGGRAAAPWTAELALLRAQVEALARQGVRGEPVALTPGARERLRSLGYLDDDDDD